MADSEDAIRNVSNICNNNISTSSTASTSTSPPPLSSPHTPSLGRGGPAEAEDCRRPKSGSPAYNGYDSGSSPVQQHHQQQRCVQEAASSLARGGLRDGSFCSSPAPSRLKQEAEVDGPLDFSLRRRDSVSESLTDDSRTSSSISPPGHPHHHLPLPLSLPHAQSTPLRHSPDHAVQHLYLHQAHRDGSPRAHSLPHIGRSPDRSPDLTDGGRLGGTTATPSSSANPSLAALGLMSEGSALTPAAMAAMLGHNGMIGPLGSILGTKNGGTPNGNKVQRPFKAYPKEALQMPLGYLGLPGVNPFPGLDPTMLGGMGLAQDDVMALYRQQMELLKEHDKLAPGKSSRSPPSSSASSFNGSSSSSSSPANPPHSRPVLPPSALSHADPATPSPLSSPAAYFSSPPQSTPTSKAPRSLSPSSQAPPFTSAQVSFPAPHAPSLVSSTSSGTSRKRPRTLPDTEKDEAYWERRRKNNDAAKRSRDARRAKEDEIALRAALLEQENLKLRVEVAALKTETARLRCMLYNT